MNFLQGLVLRGTHNVFTVRPFNTEFDIECRIKGKILAGKENFYNPIAAGDIVNVEIDSSDAKTGKILSLNDRKNFFGRFNQKGNSTQILAANVDLVLCFTTPASPPFRPRFLDRVLLQADIAGITPIIICNKNDIFKNKNSENIIDSDSNNDSNTNNDSNPIIDMNDTDDSIDTADSSDIIDIIDIEERLENFKQIGFEVMFVSAKTGEGLDELNSKLNGKRSVMIGQSGVGKSSLINALVPSANIKTGNLNQKYNNRGNHTTTLAFMLEINSDTWLIDTPGIRRFVPSGIHKKEDVVFHIREFAPFAGKCSYGASCSHTAEPGCKIMEAVHAGVIHEDRYKSFLRICDEIPLTFPKFNKNR